MKESYKICLRQTKYRHVTFRVNYEKPLKASLERCKFIEFFPAALLSIIQRNTLII